MNVKIGNKSVEGNTFDDSKKNLSKIPVFSLSIHQLKMRGHYILRKGPLSGAGAA